MVKDVILTLAVMLAAGLAAGVLSDLLRLPRMIGFLGAGIVLGPHATGAIDVPLDSLGAQLLFSLGVSLILFYGGLELSLRVLSRVGIGLGLLAVPGVFVTALIAGATASAVFDLPYSEGFLIGAVLAPTDPAILIPLFERMPVRPRLLQTIVAESALNDPTGAVLALTTAAFVLEGGGSVLGAAGDFFSELGISIALGTALGFLLALVISETRFGIWRESPALVVGLAVALGYVGIGEAGGSGYLGAFIAGLIAGNARLLGLSVPERARREVDFFSSFAADLVVLLIFVTLGLNLPLDTMASKALPALAVLGTLLVVARPIVVLACLLPDRRARWTANELAFLAWTRETGVVPASLAGLLVARGIPHAETIVTVVAYAVVVTLAVQSTTKPWLARRLRLLRDSTAPAVEL